MRPAIAGSPLPSVLFIELGVAVYVGEFYFTFPLFVVADPRFFLVKDHLPLFTEQLLAERLSDGNTVSVIENLDDLERVVDFYEQQTTGACFDPAPFRDQLVSRVAVPWEILRLSVTMERINPGGG